MLKNFNDVRAKLLRYLIPECTSFDCSIYCQSYIDTIDSICCNRHQKWSYHSLLIPILRLDISKGWGDNRHWRCARCSCTFVYSTIARASCIRHYTYIVYSILCISPIVSSMVTGYWRWSNILHPSPSRSHEWHTTFFLKKNSCASHVSVIALIKHEVFD